jgi:SAM-dependent methyltransferase
MPVAGDPEGLSYTRQVFEIRTIDEARRIILTDEDSSTDVRWEHETPYLTSCIADFLAPDESSLLLDYGCGIGRLSKELIVRSNCSVIGVDISLSMRQLAPAYVLDSRFAACGLPFVDALIGSGILVDGAFAVWSLQHSPRVEEDLERIDRILKPGGRFFVCNLYRACVPTNKGWIDFGFDIQSLLAARFEVIGVEGISEKHTSKKVARDSFLGRYRKAPQ